jgi:AraC-like DNA-binding protein
MICMEGKSGSVAGQYVSLVLDYLRATGHAPEALFGAERVAAMEAADAPLRLTAAEYLEMLERAVAVTGDPDLGFNAGVRIQPRHLGVVGYVLMCCATLDEAMQQYDRYVRLVHGIGRPLVERHGNRVEMPLDWPAGSPPPPALAQLIMTTRARMGRLLTGQDSAVMDVSFQFPAPRDPEAYQRFFGGEVRFAAARTRLAFSAEYLDVPVIMANPEMARLIRAQAETQMSRLAEEPEFLLALKNVLLQGLAIGRILDEDVAQRMSLSPRTLHRRLKEHGGTFRDLLDEVRKDRARHYLLQTQHSLADIAFMLGYTEQSAFQHAFKRWMGVTPGQYKLAARTVIKSPLPPGEGRG